MERGELIRVLVRREEVRDRLEAHGGGETLRRGLFVDRLRGHRRNRDLARTGQRGVEPDGASDSDKDQHNEKRGVFQEPPHLPGLHPAAIADRREVLVDPEHHQDEFGRDARRQNAEQHSGEAGDRREGTGDRVERERAERGDQSRRPARIVDAANRTA